VCARVVARDGRDDAGGVARGDLGFSNRRASFLEVFYLLKKFCSVRTGLLATVAKSVKSVQCVSESVSAVVCFPRFSTFGERRVGVGLLVFTENPY